MDLKIRFTADATAVERGLAGVANMGAKAGQAIGAEISKRIGAAFSAAALIGGISSFARTIGRTVDEVKDLSDALDLSIEDTQRLQVAADRAGVKFGNVQTALQKIEALRAQAADGDKNALGIFGALGVDPSQGTSLDLLQRSVEAVSNGMAKPAALFDLVGKKANALRNVVFELHQLGPINIFDEEAVRAVDEVNNVIKDIKRNIIASAAPELGFWGRALKRGTEIDQKSPGAFNFAMTRGILAEIMGGTEGGVDLSALPLPIRDKGSAGNVITPVSPMSSPAIGRSGDALSRIGLFVGGAPGVQSLRSIERNTADAASVLRDVRSTLNRIERQNSES